MDYNTSKQKLILPEYGRNIQTMIDQVKQIENRDHRNIAARTLINVMGNLNPHLRDVNDFRHKLWDHLFLMADFDLDIDSPYPIPTRESFAEPPKRVPYNQNRVRYRHFGHVIAKIVEAAAEYPSGEEKGILVSIIASHMKKSYTTWNKEGVTDETIFEAITEYSNGKLTAADSARLQPTRETPTPSQNQQTHNHHNHHNNYYNRAWKKRPGRK